MRARLGKSDEVTRLTFRVPIPLHEYLAHEAYCSSRSLNFEIVTRLLASKRLDALLNMDDPSEILEEFGKLKRWLKDFRVPQESGQ